VREAAPWLYEGMDQGTDPSSFLDRGGFSVVCEIEPPRRPDLSHLRRQIGVLAPIADAFLVPDNHLGRATVSSLAVAAEVGQAGSRAIACLNARDRNLLGFRRDLLTAAAHGIDHFLCVYGDAPREGRRTDDLTVRGMIDQVRSFGTGPLFSGFPAFRVGTVARPGRRLAWRARAEFLLVQITFSHERLLRWRESVDYSGRVYPGVLVLSDGRMARRISASIPEIRVPAAIADKLDDDPMLGVHLACEQIAAIRDSGAFDGVHLVPVGRYREVAAALSGGPLQLG
jgi:methylenetetrahydrofolate reductase (NADPH)